MPGVTATSGRDGHAESAPEIWRRIYDLILREHELRLGTLAGEGLTPGDVKALLRLDPDEPMSMRGLAEAWKCDATTVTWMVDRLERRDFVERRTPPADRRVKLVVLTRTGRDIRRSVTDRLHEPPARFGDLTATDLARLRRMLDKLDRD